MNYLKYVAKAQRYISVYITTQYFYNILSKARKTINKYLKKDKMKYK